VHAKLRVLALSVVTDLAYPDAPAAVSHDQVLAAAAARCSLER